MASPMKIRATTPAGVTEVKALTAHPMEPGRRKDADGQLVPAHYITEVTAQHNGKLVLSALWGPAVSQNPFLQFRFKGGAAGDKVVVAWKDTKGETRTDEVVLS
jgi:sulfur-oxidizing protein SoxZ